MPPVKMIWLDTLKSFYAARKLERGMTSTRRSSRRPKVYPQTCCCKFTTVITRTKLFYLLLTRRDSQDNQCSCQEILLMAEMLVHPRNMTSQGYRKVVKEVCFHHIHAFKKAVSVVKKYMAG